MRKFIWTQIIMLALSVNLACSQNQKSQEKTEPAAEPVKQETASAMPEKNVIVVMETNLGILEIELLFDHAPLTAKNFYDLVNKKFYDSLTFHRLVPNFVIQGGDPDGTGMGGPGYSIKDEKSTQPQVRGTLGMAKSGPNTTGSQFYINLIDNTRLDGAGFTGFAKVVKGMEVADKISALPRDASDKPKQPVVILKAYVKPEAEVKPKEEPKGGK